MAQDSLEMVRMRNQFYRHNYSKMVMTVLMLVVAVIIMLSMFFWLFTHQPKPVYFATRSDGSLIKLTNLNEPNMPDSAVLQWAANAAVAANTYDFSNYRSALQQSQKYFTVSGWQEFLAALKRSNNLDTVLAKKLMVTTVVTGAPVVKQQGEIRGTYAWQIQLPMVLTYQSASEKFNQKVLVSLLVVRVTELDNPQGLGINQWVATAG